MVGSDPISYEVLTKGTAVLGASGSQFAVVEHVLQDPSLDLFDGIAVKDAQGLRFVDANQVTTITDDAVQTTLTDEQVSTLPTPQGDAVLEADPEEFTGPGLSSWFGRMFLREHWMRDRDGKGNA